MQFQLRLPTANKDFWGSTDPAFECLVDNDRTKAFKKCILNTITTNDVVVDAGAGTGILSLFAAKRAKKVYAIESDPHLCTFFAETLKQNQIDNVIIINQDVLKVHIKEAISVVIAEMISTGLIDELQVPAINHLKQFTSPSATFIPFGVHNTVDLVQSNNIYYGEQLFLISYEYAEYKKTKAIVLSNKKYLSKVIFGNSHFDDLCQSFNQVFVITRNGILNGIRISTTTFLDKNSRFFNSYAYCMPLILPVPSIAVKKGEKYKVKINYELSGGLGNLSYSIE